MKINVIPAGELTPMQVRAWLDIQKEGLELDFPSFRPEFTQAVAKVRDDVEVALIEDSGELVGFFPFQRTRWGIGKPVGYPMADYQGAVLRARCAIDPMQLVRECRLKAWDFDHLLRSQHSFARFRWRTAESPFMDLGAGYDAYRASCVTPNSRRLSNAMRLARKAERDLGPMRFAAHDERPDAFQKLLEWKSAQYLRTGARDLFACSWTVSLLRELQTYRAHGFSVMLSTLRFGDRLAAVHYGFRSERVLHGWFPAYDVELGHYSPGMVVWIELARAARDAGIHRIDLGRGVTPYKAALMSGSIQVCEGSVARTPITRAVRSGCRRIREWAAESRIREPLRRSARMLSQWQTWFSTR